MRHVTVLAGRKWIMMPPDQRALALKLAAAYVEQYAPGCTLADDEPYEQVFDGERWLMHFEVQPQ
jgi:hypothetical protein